ncbi:AAA family ATPase, partial [Streptomyces sp. NPDC058964]
MSESTGAGEDMGTNRAGTTDAHDGSPTLTAGIRRVLARVDAHAARAAGTRDDGADGTDTDGTDTDGTAVVPAGPGTAPLDALVTCFGLTAFERDLVLLTAAQELDPTTAARCAAASGDPGRTYPTLSLALAALDGPHWSAVTPVAPLRRWRIVELEDESRLTTSRLRIDERILHFLLGSAYLDTRLHGQLRRTAVPAALPPSYDLAASRVAEGWTSVAGPDAPPLVEVSGGARRR